MRWNMRQNAAAEASRLERASSIAAISTQRCEELERKQRLAAHEQQARTRKAMHTRGQLNDIAWTASASHRNEADVRSMLREVKDITI